MAQTTSLLSLLLTRCDEELTVKKQLAVAHCYIHMAIWHADKEMEIGAALCTTGKGRKFDFDEGLITLSQ